MKIRKVGLILLFIVLAQGCAEHYGAASYSGPYGFFSGIWHGIAFPFALIANIVSWILSIFGLSVFPDIELVGRPNTGFSYYFGYFWGLSSWGEPVRRTY